MRPYINRITFAVVLLHENTEAKGRSRKLEPLSSVQEIIAMKHEYSEIQLNCSALKCIKKRQQCQKQRMIDQ